MMENKNQRKKDADELLDYLRSRKESNMETLEKRLHELAMEKQRRDKKKDKTEGMV